MFSHERAGDDASCISRAERVGVFLFDPSCDEFPNSGLEGFTRKSFNPISNLLCRPFHCFKSADCANEVIRVLIREKNSIDSITNDFG